MELYASSWPMPGFLADVYEVTVANFGKHAKWLLNSYVLYCYLYFLATYFSVIKGFVRSSVGLLKQK